MLAARGKKNPKAIEGCLKKGRKSFPRSPRPLNKRGGGDGRLLCRRVQKAKKWFQALGIAG